MDLLPDLLSAFHAQVAAATPHLAEEVLPDFPGTPELSPVLDKLAEARSKDIGLAQTLFSSQSQQASRELLIQADMNGHRRSPSVVQSVLQGPESIHVLLQH
jgi:hypothetical protein